MGSTTRMFQPARCGIDGCTRSGTIGITIGGGKGPPSGYAGGFYCSQEHVDLAEARLKELAERERKAYESLRDRLDGRFPVLFMSKRQVRAGLSWLGRSSRGWF